MLSPTVIHASCEGHPHSHGPGATPSRPTFLRLLEGCSFLYGRVRQAFFLSQWMSGLKDALF